VIRLLLWLWFEVGGVGVDLGYVAFDYLKIILV